MYLIIILSIIAAFAAFFLIKSRNSSLAPSTDRVRLDYHDQNEPFGRLLPVLGTIRGPILIDKRQYVVIDLDKDLDYDVYTFNTVAVTERLVGETILSSEPAHVHILIPKVPLNKDAYSFDEFDHIAWGITVPI